jgi:hypothetical protein
MIELLIGRAGWNHLRIAISDRCHSNWFNADVQIRCGGLSAKYTATFESGELRSFAAEIRRLYRELSGSACLKQKGPSYLAVTCKGDGRGHIWLTGVAEERPQQGPKLVFELSLEQTDLPLIADTLEAMDSQSPH